MPTCRAGQERPWALKPSQISVRCGVPLPMLPSLSSSVRKSVAIWALMLVPECRRTELRVRFAMILRYVEGLLARRFVRTLHTIPEINWPHAWISLPQDEQPDALNWQVLL